PRSGTRRVNRPWRAEVNRALSAWAAWTGAPRRRLARRRAVPMTRPRTSATRPRRIRTRTPRRDTCLRAALAAGARAAAAPGAGALAAVAGAAAVTPRTDRAAANAFRAPAPLSPSKPAGPRSVAVARRTSPSWAGDRSGRAWRSRASVPETCGAAIEVPE